VCIPASGSAGKKALGFCGGDRHAGPTLGTSVVVAVQTVVEGTVLVLPAAGRLAVDVPPVASGVQREGTDGNEHKGKEHRLHGHDDGRPDVDERGEDRPEQVRRRVGHSERCGGGAEPPDRAFDAVHREKRGGVVREDEQHHQDPRRVNQLRDGGGNREGERQREERDRSTDPVLRGRPDVAEVRRCRPVSRGGLADAEEGTSQQHSRHHRHTQERQPDNNPERPILSGVTRKGERARVLETPDVVDCFVRVTRG
jgi:hypothetical protein